MSYIFTIIACVVISITGWSLIHPPKNEIITPSHPSQRLVSQEVKTVILEKNSDTFLPPEMRDHPLEAVLNDEPSYSSKGGLVYSSKDCYSSKDAKGVLEPVAQGLPNPLDNMWIPPIPPIIRPPHVTDVDPPIHENTRVPTTPKTSIQPR